MVGKRSHCRVRDEESDKESDKENSHVETGPGQDEGAVRDVIFFLLLLSLMRGAGRKSLKGEGREWEEKFLASGTPRAGLCHSGTLASACVLRMSSKSSCPEFT